MTGKKRPPAIHRAIELALGIGLLASFGYWGSQSADNSTVRWILTVATPLLFGLIWLVLRAPGDRRSLPVAFHVPGRVKLVVELAVIGLAATAVWTAGSRAASETLLTAFAIHYALTYDRIAKLVRNPDGQVLETTHQS